MEHFFRPPGRLLFEVHFLKMEVQEWSIFSDEGAGVEHFFFRYTGGRLKVLWQSVYT